MTESFELNLNIEYSPYNSVLFKCIENNIVSFQETYDVSEELFKNLINDDFLNAIKTYMISCLKESKSELEKKEIKSVSDDYYLNNKLKTENCGYIKECFMNGFIQYCNVHKYEHTDQQHSFVHKSYKDAINEYNTNIKFTLYCNFVMKLNYYIKKYIQDLIKNYYKKYEVENDYKEWLLKNNLCFKKRSVNNIYYIENSKVEEFNAMICFHQH